MGPKGFAIASNVQSTIYQCVNILEITRGLRHVPFSSAFDGERFTSKGKILVERRGKISWFPRIKEFGKLPVSSARDLSYLGGIYISTSEGRRGRDRKKEEMKGKLQHLLFGKDKTIFFPTSSTSDSDKTCGLRSMLRLFEVTILYTGYTIGSPIMIMLCPIVSPSRYTYSIVYRLTGWHKII